MCTAVELSILTASADIELRRGLRPSTLTANLTDGSVYMSWEDVWTCISGISQLAHTFTGQADHCISAKPLRDLELAVDPGSWEQCTVPNVPWPVREY